MKESKIGKSFRVLALVTVMFGGLVVAAPKRAYAQQDVDPSWYDPSGTSNTVVTQSTQTRAAAKQQQKKVKSASSSTSSTERTAKLRAKRNATQARPS